MALLNWLWSLLKAAASIALPLVKEVPWRGFPAVLRWVLHFLILGLVLVGLWYLNGYFHLEKALRGPWPRLHQVWLPLLFLLVYLLAWLGFRLYRLLGPEHESSEFPDIDAVWKEAMAALHQANMDVTEAPLFLILGQPAAGDEALFTAAQMPLTVAQTPRRADAPLHLFAQREGIFITCPGASLLGKQASLYAEEEQGPTPEAAVAETARLQEAQSILAKAKEQGRSLEQLTADEQQQLARLAATPAPPEAENRRRSFLNNQQLIQLCQDRLRYLCHLLVRDRRPYCPINGLLLLVPFKALSSDQEASQTATFCQQDLAIIRQTLDVDCPIFVLVGDLENCPGFSQFLSICPESQRQRSLGQRFPLLPDISRNERLEMFQHGVEAIALKLLPSLMFQLFYPETSTAMPSGHLPETMQKNIDLFRFLFHLRQRRQHLARLVLRCAEPAPGDAAMIAACYLAGTGIDPRFQQAFVPEIFQEMLRNQNFVAWTPQALAEEAAFRRYLRLGYTSLGLSLTILIGLVCYTYFF